MKMDKYHCLGSRWFCLQMQQALEAQSRILDEFLRDAISDKLQKVFPLIVAVRGTAHAIIKLRQDAHLNEAHVLMRLLIERVINLCFLLVQSDEVEERGKQEPRTNGRKEKIQVNSAEELIAATKDFRFAESYDSEALDRKIALLNERTEIQNDFLRLVIASHYPKASEALRGSVLGAVSHLAQSGVEDDSESYFQKEFATLFFTSSLLLHGAIRLLATEKETSGLLSSAKESFKKATDLMSRIQEPIEENIQDSEGSWENLGDLEHMVMRGLGEKLNLFADGFRLCVEAGVQAPTLPHSHRGALRLKLSALFLKRILNDIRTSWLLLNRGYTSQAASIAASLFESALVVQCIAPSDPLAARLNHESTGELPWSVADMCKMVVRKDNPKPTKDAWTPLYAQYVWLCQIKHPTLPQTLHDAGSTAYGEAGYTVMALPDIREEDLGVKKLLCIIILSESVRAIESFASGAGVDTKSEQGVSFSEKVERVNNLLKSQMEAKSRLNIPFTIQNSKWVRQQTRNSRQKPKAKPPAAASAKH